MSTQTMYNYATNTLRQPLNMRSTQSLLGTNNIIDRRGSNLLQRGESITFMPPTADLGSMTAVVVSFSNTDEFYQTEIKHEIRFDIENADATNSIILKSIWSAIEKLKVIINDTSSFEVKDYETFRYIWGDILLAQGEDMFINSSYARDEISTTNGFTILPSTMKTFILPLDPIITFARTQIFSGKHKKSNWPYADIITMRLEFTPRSEVLDAANSCKICRSSADVAMWTRAKLEFRNIRYIRDFVINSGANMVVPFFQTPSKKSFIIHETKEKIVYTGQWSKAAGSTCSFQTQDIHIAPNIQEFYVYARVKPTTFNDATAGKQYSGYQHIGYDYRELGGSQRKVDMTDARNLRQYEIDQYRDMYGIHNRLPLEIINTDSSFSHDFLQLTRFTFDHLRVDGNNEVLRFINTSGDLSAYRFVVNLYANSERGASVEVVVVAVTAVEYLWDEKTGQFEKSKAF